RAVPMRRARHAHRIVWPHHAPELAPHPAPTHRLGRRTRRLRPTRVTALEHAMTRRAATPPRLELAIQLGHTPRRLDHTRVAAVTRREVRIVALLARIQPPIATAAARRSRH